MTRVAVFDCFSGIAGDMTIAALLDAGASLAEIRRGLASMPLPEFEITAHEVTRGGMRALHAHVSVSREETYQPGQMRSMLAAAAIPERARTRALAAVASLEQGEWLAHGGQEVHLHEAGGVDAMIDITGSMLGLESLGIDEAVCPVVTVGAGTMVRSAHGPLPAAPGPAAAHILQNARFPMRFVEAGHELVTPTGAAILAAVAKPGAVTLTARVHGAGAGTMDPPGRPNAVRIFIGDLAEAAPGTDPFAGTHAVAAGGQRVLSLLEANIDDMPATLLGHVRDLLLTAGARDAWIEPIAMKKGRAASKLCLLVEPEREEAFATLMMRETTTLGVRTTAYRRWEAERNIEVFETSLGPVRFKVSSVEGRVRAAPEHDDVVALAARRNLPAVEVQRVLEREGAEIVAAR
jgi:uncharacterized protein (TIGR00299 family) protein